MHLEYKMEDNVVNEVMQTLNSVGAEALAEYTKWHIVSALGWTVASILVFVYSIQSKFDKWDEDAAVFIKGGLISVSILTFLCFLPDLFSPRAIAIHSLIRDITGY